LTSIATLRADRRFISLKDRFDRISGLAADTRTRVTELSKDATANAFLTEMKRFAGQHARRADKLCLHLHLQ
jgi:hypothetical protein